MIASAPRDHALKVCTLGMNDRAQESLRFLFRRQMADRCILADGDSAHVAVVDIDTHSSATLLSEHRRRHPERPLVVLSLNGSVADIPNAILVRKPIHVHSFIQALQYLHDAVFRPGSWVPTPPASARMPAPQIETAATALVAPTPRARPAAEPDRAATHMEARRNHHFIGSMPDGDLTDATARARAAYVPGEFLQGFVQLALARGIDAVAVVRLSGPAFDPITIYPFARRIVFGGSSRTLYAAARLPLKAREVRCELLRGTGHTPPDDQPGEPYDPVLWKLALYASRGRVPAGTPFDAPVKLRRWPNLTRLVAPPHAARIAGLWSRHPCSLAETARLLEIPQRFVFAFYSASNALDLVSLPPARELPAPTPPPASEKRGIFRLLLDKLTGPRKA